MERAEKRDDVVALRVVLRQLDRRLDGLGARVAEERPHRPVDRRDLRHLLGQLHLRLVVEVGARHVQVALRLIDDGLHDVGMRVAGGVDGDAGGAVEKVVAVDVLDDRALSAGHDERIVARVGRRHVALSRAMSAAAFGPGSVVLSSGASIVVESVSGGAEARLHIRADRLRPCAQHAHAPCAAAPHFRFHRVPPGPSSSRIPRGEIVADAVGCGEVAATPGGVAILDQPLDLLRSTGGCASSACRSAITPRTRSKCANASRTPATSRCAEAARRRSPRSATAPDRTSPPAPPTC